MESFYLIVLGIATVILILILTFVGIMMKSQNAGTVFPPVANTCPDGWAVYTDGSSCIVPTVGAVNAGIYPDNTPVAFTAQNTPSYTINSDGNTINATNPAWTTVGGKTAVCAQKAWANQMGVSWDGVSNYNSC